jgi:glutamate transport system substrate-binding protein
MDAGDVDAVTTDNVILLGFIAENPDGYKLVDSGTFTDEPYGIGVQKGDDPFRDFINDVLEEIVADGRYNAAWDATAGQFDPNPPTPPTVDRY